MKKAVIYFCVSSIVFLVALCSLPTIMKKITNNLYRSQIKKKNISNDDDWTIEYVKKSDN